MLNVIFMQRIIFNTVSNAFWSTFYKPGPSYSTRLFKLNYIKHTHQTWILAPDIGQCPEKNRIISDKSCFTTDTVVCREVKKCFTSYRGLETHNHLVSIGFSCSCFSFYEHFNRQFTYAVFLHSNPSDVF